MEKIVQGAGKLKCKCGQMMTLKEGFSEKINTKTNKPYGIYKVWRCDDRSCKLAEFVHEDKISIKNEYNKLVSPTAQINKSFPEVTHQEPTIASVSKLAQEVDKMTKEDWANKQAGISALALCKVKAIAGGYNKDADDMKEDIYNDYIFFSNRLNGKDEPF